MLACFQQGKQSVWTPTAKAAGAKRIYWGQKPRAKALPTYLFFAERKQIALQSAKRNEYPDINYQFSKR